MIRTENSDQNTNLLFVTASDKEQVYAKHLSHKQEPLRVASPYERMRGLMLALSGFGASHLIRGFGSSVAQQWRSQGGGDHPPNRKKNSLKKAKSVEKLGGGGTRYILEGETD